MKELKYIGLLAILPLLMVALTSSYIGDADALGPKAVAETLKKIRGELAEDDSFNGHSGSHTNSQPVAPSVKAQQRAQAVPEAKATSLMMEQMELRGEIQQQNLAIDTQKSTKGFVPRGDDYGLETYRAVYTITNEGGGKVQNIEILVKSDSETVKAELLGFLDEKDSTITVFIKAKDPSSISGKIVGFETPQDMSKTPN